MDEPRMRVPADTAALHRAGSGHRLGKLGVGANVESAPDDMLAVLSHPEGRACEHRVRFGGTISREYRRFAVADGIQHIRQEVDHPNIDLGLLAGMVVAEKDA